MRLGLVISMCGIMWSSCAQHDSFDEMVDEILSHSVAEITVNEFMDSLSAWDYVLLDARELEEYHVSHLDGAYHVGYDDLDFSDAPLTKIEPDDMVIVYCSVGYRSEKVAEQMKDHGFTNVHNLTGGIFDWVNKGGGLVDTSNRITENIHPYDEDWGKWLIKGNKTYE